jgi:ribonucleotide monophosphatase NagD (HAD superfamily)
MISSLADIAADYDAVICDVWGVVHNGRTAYDAAGAALVEFRKTRGPVLMLSNAPRPGADVVRLLGSVYGVRADAYERARRRAPHRPRARSSSHRRP